MATAIPDWVVMKFQSSNIRNLSSAELDVIFENMQGKFNTVQAWGNDADLLTFFTRATAEGYNTLYWPRSAGSYPGWPASHNCNGTLGGWSDGDWLRADILAARTAKIAAVVAKITPLDAAGVLTGVTLDYCRYPFNAASTYGALDAADITSLAQEYRVAFNGLGINTIASGTKGTNYVQMAQDWGAWLSAGTVDMAFMMAYCSRIYGDAMFDNAPQNDKNLQRLVEAPCGISGKCSTYTQSTWDTMIARIVSKGYSDQVSALDYGKVNSGGCWDIIPLIPDSPIPPPGPGESVIDSGSIGILAFDENDVKSDSIQDLGEADPTETQSFSQSLSLNMPTADNADALIASDIAFTDNGWRWNFTSVLDTPVKFWSLSIGQVPTTPPGGPPGPIGICKIVAAFQVFLKDQTGTVVALFDDWRLLQFQRKVNSPGFFNFVISGNDDRVDLFEPDGQIEVFRSIPGLIDWQKIFEGHIENFDQTLFSNGNFQFSAIGSHYNGLLARRVIAYDVGTAEANKSAVAESVMKAYVDENIGPSATSSPRLLESGVMAGFAVEVDGVAGILWQGDRSGKNLWQVVHEIANFAAIDFDVVGTGAAAYEFRTYVNQLGIDRTVIGLDPTTGLNAAGNAPHIFSPDRDNVLDMRYALKRRKESNAIYVFGQGQSTSREIVVQSDAIAINLTPIGRRETMRGGGSQATPDELRDVGNEWLERLQAKEVFTFTPLDVESSLYGVHYNFGDSVTARLGSVERNKRITGVTFTVAGDGETKQIEFSDIP